MSQVGACPPRSGCGTPDLRDHGVEQASGFEGGRSGFAGDGLVSVWP
jgi:hypothetical protein